MTVAPAARARSIVSSVELFSTTMTSLAHSTLATHASMFADSSWAAITAVTAPEPRFAWATLATASRSRVVRDAIERVDHPRLRERARYSRASRLSHRVAVVFALEQS